MADNKGVVVFGEVIGNRLAAITTEMLGIGRKLANDLGEELSAVIMGQGISSLGQEAIALGADKVYVVDDPALKDYQLDAYLPVATNLCQKSSPNIVILGQTPFGRDLAPRLAFRLGTGLSMDCIELSIDPQSKLLVQTRPVYGGNARATFICEKTKPQIATVRPKAMSALAPDAGRKGEVVIMKADLTPGQVRSKYVQFIKQEAEGVRLEDAEVVIAGGRGIGGPEGFKQLEELAKLFGGAVGATRAACDAGWVPSTVQVGLTGKIVSPGLYIAVALSGSSQHMAGCAGSKTIVAINRDPEANIFKEARYGVVGDYKQVIPVFVQKCKELLAR